jgi:hypothetical protein
MNDIINLITQPITMVLLCVTFGWLFISFVLLPYKTKIETMNNNNRYKKETFLRLTELQISFENNFSTKIIANLLEGKTTINPDFKNWKLTALIYSGWTHSVYLNTYKTVSQLENLIEDSNTTIDKTRTVNALSLLDSLTRNLKTIPENKKKKNRELKKNKRFLQTSS